MIAPLLKLNNVSKSYLTAGGSEELRILHGINLALNRGESLAILGPSGSGKSTLLNIIGTLDRPTSGEVIFDGEDVGGLDDIALARVRNAKIGFIFQAHHLLPQCTVLENVLVPTLASADKGLRGSAPDRAMKLLDRVGLQNRLEHRPGQLSGGERQRVAVVRALINEPKLLLADEPTGALDQSSAHNLAQLLTEINREQNLTLILVTHAIDLAARMQRKVEIQNGTLVSK
ncbi:MAG: ABC transporter ATP-binding protein [Verrucomicrobiota bacterium]